MAFVFWQNVASRHQRDLLRAIAALSGEDVICAVENGLPESRTALGWGSESFEPVRLVRSDERSTFESLVSRRRDTHVLTGFLHHPVITDAFVELSGKGALAILHSESVETHGLKGGLRVSRDCIKAVKHRRQVRGVMAIGDVGVRYFEMLGFEPRRIIPFGYFVQAGPFSERTGIPGGPFRIVYAGQFIPRKGLDGLFDSLVRLKELDWTLEMIGSGPSEDSLEAKARALGVAGKVLWHGPVPPGQIHQSLAGCDLFVLPSHWDGWGVVVNEALAAGVPVVCSDRCGAACMITSSGIGEVFPVGNVDALAAILRRRILSGRVTDATREACHAAADALTPEAGARQFLAGIAALESGAPPPPAPWMRSNESRC